MYRTNVCACPIVKNGINVLVQQQHINRVADNRIQNDLLELSKYV